MKWKTVCCFFGARKLFRSPNVTKTVNRKNEDAFVVFRFSNLTFFINYNKKEK